MRVFTSHWRNRDLADLECQPVGISRGTPRGNPGFRYRKLMELAPSRETFAIQDREEFEAAYTRQLEALGAKAILGRIEQVSGGKPAVLLCWERPTDPWCHRWTLAQWIEEKAGIVVPELRAGMLSKRPDAPQPALFDGREQGWI